MIKLVLEEYLEEMATIYKSKEYGVCVAVNPDSGRSGNPYFKFFNNSDFRKANKIIRILFKKPDYVVHKDGKQLWKLNTKERKLLIQILKMESDSYEGISNWNAAKYDWNREYLEESLNIRKYFNGDYDELYKDNPGYVPSTLKMPDYSKLNIV